MVQNNTLKSECAETKYKEELRKVEWTFTELITEQIIQGIDVSYRLVSTNTCNTDWIGVSGGW